MTEERVSYMGVTPDIKHRVLREEYAKSRASSMLIDEAPLIVLPSLAANIGLNEAIFLQQLHYWLKKTGKDWVYNTAEEWQEQLPFWSISTIRRTIDSLRDKGIVVATDKFNSDNRDRTLWYSIDYGTLYDVVHGEFGVVNLTMPPSQSDELPQLVNLTMPPSQSDELYIEQRLHTENTDKEKDPPKPPTDNKSPQQTAKDEYLPGIPDPRKNGRNAWQLALNEELEPKERVPIANQVAKMLRTTALIDAGDDKSLREAHETAVLAHKMGYTKDLLCEMEDAWKEDWAYGGALPKQFLRFLSQQKEGGDKPAKKEYKQIAKSKEGNRWEGKQWT